MRGFFPLRSLALLLGWAFAGWPAARAQQADEFWGAQDAEAQPNKKDGRWYAEAKFAMFIHWGLPSLPAGVWNGQRYYGISEWLMHQAKIPVAEYERIAERFDAANFDADAIARLAVEAGMRYIVFTAKHHDGFAMYHSRVSPFNIVEATPFGRDPLAELADACRRHGLKLGIYYSQSQDWHHRHAYGNNWDFSDEGRDFQIYLEEKALPQIRELLTNYGELGLIFFDTPQGITREQVLALRDMVAQLQPNCLINSRIGQGLGDYVTLGDSEIPNKVLEGLWEAIDTHNHSWGYSVLDVDWKSPKEIVDRFVRVLCKGGNFMFNVGPKGDGSIPVESAGMLREVGQWVSRNQSAIYGTQGRSLGGQGWVEATGAPGRTNLFVREWPADGRLWLPLESGTLTRATFLANGEDVLRRTEVGRTFLVLPVRPPDSLTTVIVLEHGGDLKFSQDRWLVPGVTSVLYPHEAETQGPRYQPRVRWMENFGEWKTAAVLDRWTGPGSKATWRFFSPTGGRFYLTLEYSAGPDADLKEGLLELGGRTIPFVTIYSGDAMDNGLNARRIPRFITRRLGLVELAPGANELTIQRNHEGEGGWFRLASLRLTPTD